MTRFLIRPSRESGHHLADLASALIVATLIVLFLYLGREILEPLAIAALLGFILAPLIRRLRGWGLWRAPSVVLTVLLAMGVIGALGYTMVLQVAQLAEDLPKYESNLRTKVRALSGAPLTSGALERASNTLRDLQEEISKPSPSASTAKTQKPLLVEVRQPEPRGLESIGNVMRPLLSPLATGALVILFLVFILLQREDLRDRFLRLAGPADLQRSTEALDDAAVRLSRFFLMQTLLNAGFGVVICAGLWLIGVPNAILWGILAGLMRFVPFVGPIIAAVFPIALAAAVDPGWSMVLLTAALFLITEPLAGHVIEPVLYGQHTGLSPVAIVVSTLFWTVLWGPIGLLLATPLTVCLVVLGRHTEALEFIEVLLGDEPALEPDQRFYQRLLAGNATEAADQAEQQLKECTLSAYYDGIVLKALGLAQHDAAQGKLSRDKQMEICDTVEEIADDIDEYSDVEAGKRVPVGKAARKKADAEAAAAGPSGASTVLCIASRSPLDEAASVLLAQILRKRQIRSHVQPVTDITSWKSFKIDVLDAPLVCLSYFGANDNPVHVRYLIRRLRRLMPHAKFMACFWTLGEDKAKAEAWRSAVGADLVATSICAAADICRSEMPASSGDALPATAPQPIPV